MKSTARRVSLILFTSTVLLAGACTASKKMLTVMSTNLTKDDPQTLMRGATLYAQNCATCHGATGLGDGPLSGTLASPPRNLRDYAARHIASSIAANTRYGEGSSMPAFEGTLSPEAIWDVANYVDTFGDVPAP